MTLSTDLIIVDPVDPEALFEHVVELMRPAVEHEPIRGCFGRDADIFPNTYMTACGQGLPAWTFCRFAVDGPLTLDDPVSDDPPWYHLHCVRLTFDTGYGYDNGRGGGCGDLHAWLVTEAATWVTDHTRSDRMVWEDESGGGFWPIADIARLGDPEKGRLG